MKLTPQLHAEHREPLRVAVVVAHPDDESLWAGGLLLSHPEWNLFIVSLCRGLDPDRAPKFFKVLTQLKAQGKMGDLDDGPDQRPLPPKLVQDSVLALLPQCQYDLLLTHGPDGEYTRHRRHEEVSQAVMQLWQEGRLRTRKLWQFAYADGGGNHLPHPRHDASLNLPLPDELWVRKHQLITEIYGFDPASWEARTTPRTEAFDRLKKPTVSQTPTPPHPHSTP